MYAGAAAGANPLDIVPGAVERQGGTLELIVDARFEKNKRNRMKGIKSYEGARLEERLEESSFELTPRLVLILR